MQSWLTCLPVATSVRQNHSTLVYFVSLLTMKKQTKSSNPTLLINNTYRKQRVIQLCLDAQIYFKLSFNPTSSVKRKSRSSNSLLLLLSWSSMTSSTSLYLVLKEAVLVHLLSTYKTTPRHLCLVTRLNLILEQLNAKKILTSLSSCVDWWKR